MDSRTSSMTTANKVLLFNHIRWFVIYLSNKKRPLIKVISTIIKGLTYKIIPDLNYSL